MRVAAALLALPVLLSLGAVASADDGRPSRTVGRATELPPRRDTTKELVMLVGGLGSSVEDRTWDAVIARYRDDPRIEVRRFGADPAHPYDTVGEIDASAVHLREELRALAPRYSAIHLVTHSMGGVVADRALAEGLADVDRIRSYVALATPHNGATAARIAQASLLIAADEGLELRAAMAAVVHDPGAAAVRDLAARPTARPGPRLARLDVRLATDVLVPGPDARLSGVETRTLMPTSLDTLEGHGGVLRDPAVIELIAATIARGAPPPDDRSAVLREATSFAATAADELAALMWIGLAAAALALAHALRIARYPRAITRPLAERALAGR